MNAPMTSPLAQYDPLSEAIQSAVESIAPNWPLDKLIAVSPYWGRIHQPFEEVARELELLAGSPMTLPLADYRSAWDNREIGRSDLQQAIAERGGDLTVEELVSAFGGQDPEPLPAPLLCDMVDRERDLRREPAWCDTVTHQISQFCAAYFDREQAEWSPASGASLYESWRKNIRFDRGIGTLMKAPEIAERAAALLPEPECQIRRALTQLAVPEQEWSRYLQALLLRVNGWAAWCAYLHWQAQLAERSDHSLIDLLAMRLSWETLLDDGQRGEGSRWARWKAEWQRRVDRSGDRPLAIRHVWQRAREIAFQRQLGDRILSAPVSLSAGAPAVQAVFCIDVRSEVLRRHLEAQSAPIQTLGFAGFFGLPIHYTPLGADSGRPQLPGLFAPTLNITDSTGEAGQDEAIAERRKRNLAGSRGWRTFQSAPLSTFTLVEALGLGYLGKLLKNNFPGLGSPAPDDRLGLSDRDAGRLRPTLATAVAGADEQAKLAAGILRGMGLDKQFARLVLLVGHGSETRNNPHRAGLDCGACCGQTGEANARALAGLLNDAGVRHRLQKEGIRIPDSTRFVAGLHNTTTDEVRFFDLDDLPGSHAADLETVRRAFDAAGDAARAERAPALGGEAEGDRPRSLFKSFRHRASDWSQTRPEWGLADNAAFIVAPRSRTRGVDLQGRCFLHDYDHRRDPDGTLLEKVLTGPMLVTHWINMQYYASTVDNKRFGSGNKTLHNVVGGRIGVFEGNGGDLRIGLPWQSVHDGERWRHTSVRLTVVVEAPRDAIADVIARHETLRQLLDNQWLYLMRFDGTRLERYHRGRWQAFSESKNRLAIATMNDH